MTCLVYINTNTHHWPTSSVYSTGTDAIRPLCYKPRPHFIQERWLVWRDSISPFIGASMCQSERGLSAHGGNEATLTPISVFVAFDFLQHRTESSVLSESRRRWENIHFPEMMKCFRDCIRLQDKEWLFICTHHTNNNIIFILYAIVYDNNITVVDAQLGKIIKIAHFYNFAELCINYYSNIVVIMLQCMHNMTV